MEKSKMNCKDIRAAIDSASRRAPLGASVQSHLTGCPDCRRHADEMNALLQLLGAQPRVQAPADFDFRLRARIARAQAEPRGAFAALENFWTRTFSWGQAAAAMATLTVTIGLGAMYFDGGDKQSQLVANNAAPTQQFVAEAPKANLNAAPEAVAVREKVAVKATKAAAPVMQSAVFTETERPAVIAANLETTKVYNREKGQMMTASNRSTIYGAEDAGLAKTVAFVPSL